jgi:hypothetical protein
MVGGSVLLASGGNTTIQGFVGDVVGHLFSAALLAVVPIVGYRLLYKQIGEKEITFIFAAAWAYLVFAQFFGS